MVLLHSYLPVIHPVAFLQMIKREKWPTMMKSLVKKENMIMLEEKFRWNINGDKEPRAALAVLTLQSIERLHLELEKQSEGKLIDIKRL